MLKIHYRRDKETACGRWYSQVMTSSYYSAVSCASCRKVVEKEIREADALIDRVLRET